MHIQPTLYFRGACRDAIAFYVQALGAEVLSEQTVANTIPPDQARPGTEHMMLRAVLRIGESVIYLADGHGEPPAQFAGISLSLATRDEAEAQRYATALADGGSTRLPLRPTLWAGLYGMVIDRFGVCWTVEAPLAAPAV
ncbi:VOC family protein [Massilia arenosa]|uniref:VOC family protein n=1 Tax=Zemynaea arenosa TaxID=2561931 RepID=A0A4Y9SCJ7_9BURK|nr:VOC family protein [Massilia arenosa]TFW17406.1 VOC family protein [Massilia arenosa]